MSNVTGVTTGTKPVERRRARRRRSLEEHGIESARVRPGIRVAIVDVSAGGVLVETRQRLLPGMPLEVHFERHRQLSTMRGRVLRCIVFRVTSSSICYRGAIGFNGNLAWFEEDLAPGSPFTAENA